MPVRSQLHSMSKLATKDRYEAAADTAESFPKLKAEPPDRAPGGATVSIKLSARKLFPMRVAKCQEQDRNCTCIVNQTTQHKRTVIVAQAPVTPDRECQDDTQQPRLNRDAERPEKVVD